jgi:hypothetical protein
MNVPHPIGYLYFVSVRGIAKVWLDIQYRAAVKGVQTGHLEKIPPAFEQACDGGQNGIRAHRAPRGEDSYQRKLLVTEATHHYVSEVNLKAVFLSKQPLQWCKQVFIAIYSLAALVAYQVMMVTFLGMVIDELFAELTFIHATGLFQYLKVRYMVDLFTLGILA